MQPANTMRSAIADAVGAEPDDGTEEDSSEAATEEVPTPAASAEGEDQSPDTDDAADDSEAREGTEQVPSEYFGTPLPGTPAQRLELIEALKKRDDTIGTLLRGQASDDKPDGTEVEPEPPTMPTDAEILAALGLDPENNPFDEQAAKVALPLVKRQMEQDQTLAQMLETQELGEIDRAWRSGLSGLEREFGPLPVELDHDRVMEFAAEQGITSPVDAYWRIVGPGRAAVSEVMQRAEKEAQRTAAKKAATTARPSSTEADDDPALVAKTAKGATREVARRLMADLGLDA